MRRLSREQWMTVALALVAIVVTGYYVHQQRHIGDQNQAFASLMGANQAYSSLEHDFREYAPLALKSDLFLGTNAVHGYPEFTDHLFKATVAMDAVYELWSLSGREAPLLSEALCLSCSRSSPRTTTPGSPTSMPSRRSFSRLHVKSWMRLPRWFRGSGSDSA
jgi:hypothetical protein